MSQCDYGTYGRRGRCPEVGVYDEDFLVEDVTTGGLMEVRHHYCATHRTPELAPDDDPQWFLWNADYEEEDR